MYNCDLKFAVSHVRDFSYNVKEHFHPCYEIVYYEEGSGTTTINGKTYSFKPNTFSVIKPNSKHDEVVPEPGIKLVYIGFEIRDDDGSLEEGVFPGDNGKTALLDTMRMIRKEVDNRSYLYSQIIRNLTETAVIYAKRLQDKSLNEVDDDNLDFIRDFIHYNCMKNINGKTVAKSVGYSYDYLRKVFKKHFNISLKEYIDNEKMAVAVSLLENTKHSVNKVASLCGYSSTSHFISCFGQVYGMTPSKYIQQHKNKAYVNQSKTSDGGKL